MKKNVCQERKMEINGLFTIKMEIMEVLCRKMLMSVAWCRDMARQRNLFFAKEC